jgi:hypothetical protein
MSTMYDANLTVLDNRKKEAINTYELDCKIRQEEGKANTTPFYTHTNYIRTYKLHVLVRCMMCVCTCTYVSV